MMNVQAPTAGKGILLPGVLAHSFAVLAVLCMTIFAPFIVHLLPAWGDARWGERLLPIFYAPLLVTLRLPLGVAAMFSLSTPWLNHVATGHPTPAICLLLTFQLTSFCLGLYWLRRQIGLFFWLCWPAYLFSVITGCLVLVVWPALLPFTNAPQYLLRSLTITWPGLLVLLLLNWLAVRTLPPTASV